MSTAHAATFDTAINEGLDNASRIEAHISTSASDTRVGFSNPASVVGDNPIVVTDAAVIDATFSRDGEEVKTNDPKTYESNLNGQDIAQYKVRVGFGGGVQDYGTWNDSNSGFPQTFNNGDEVTISLWNIDCNRDGISEALILGSNNLSADIHLLDGGGSRIGGWATKSGTNPLASSSAIEYSSNQTFTNTSGSSQTVGGIEVVWQNQGTLVIQDSFSNTSVPDGADIVFTTLEVQFSGLE
jgi:hypothetical protein